MSGHTSARFPNQCYSLAPTCSHSALQRLLVLLPFSNNSSLRSPTRPKNSVFSRNPPPFSFRFAASCSASDASREVCADQSCADWTCSKGLVSHQGARKVKGGEGRTFWIVVIFLPFEAATRAAFIDSRLWRGLRRRGALLGFAGVGADEVGVVVVDTVAGAGDALDCTVVDGCVILDVLGSVVWAQSLISLTDRVSAEPYFLTSGCVLGSRTVSL